MKDIKHKKIAWESPTVQEFEVDKMILQTFVTDAGAGTEPTSVKPDLNTYSSSDGTYEDENPFNYNPFVE